MNYFSKSIIIFLLLLPTVLHAKSDRAIKNGVLDLRQETITEKYIIELNGEWEFYWKKLQIGRAHV